MENIFVETLAEAPEKEAAKVSNFSDGTEHALTSTCTDERYSWRNSYVYLRLGCKCTYPLAHIFSRHAFSRHA